MAACVRDRAVVASINSVGGANAIGRVDMVENRLVGMKSRGVYETPGGTILHAAHHEVESLVLPAGVLRMKEMLAPRYAELIYNGQWFTPLRQALDAHILSQRPDLRQLRRVVAVDKNELMGV